MRMLSKQEQGKRNKSAGNRFEAKVSEDLISKGWIVIKNPNDVRDNIFKKTKTKWNPFTKRPMMLGSGFPDFITYRISKDNSNYFVINGVECKSGKYLTKEEKEKCEWLLKNKIFLSIIIASKGKKRGEIKYENYK